MIQHYSSYEKMPAWYALKGCLGPCTIEAHAHDAHLRCNSVEEEADHCKGSCNRDHVRQEEINGWNLHPVQPDFTTCDVALAEMLLSDINSARSASEAPPEKHHLAKATWLIS